MNPAERDPGVGCGSPFLCPGNRLKVLGSVLGLVLLAQDAGAGPARLAGVEPPLPLSNEVSAIRSREARGGVPLGLGESAPVGSRALDLAGPGPSQDSLQGLTQVLSVTASTDTWRLRTRILYWVGSIRITFHRSLVPMKTNLLIWLERELRYNL